VHSRWDFEYTAYSGAVGTALAEVGIGYSCLLVVNWVFSVARGMCFDEI
jgi:hypothetical protein